jgi:flavin-binding protein dodecin
MQTRFTFMGMARMNAILAPDRDHVEGEMSSAQENSVYKVIEIVGVSSESWEAATKAAVERASKTLRDLRVAEVMKLDVAIEDGKVARYRARLSVSFKYEGED